jgi:P2-related tail formation protein
MERNLPESHQRELVRRAWELYRFRGTASSLRGMIKVCTGLDAHVETSGPFELRVSLRLPEECEVTADEIEHLVRRHKPAFVSYVLEIQ